MVDTNDSIANPGLLYKPLGDEYGVSPEFASVSYFNGTPVQIQGWHANTNHE